jgi:hypothetical protein
MACRHVLDRQERFLHTVPRMLSRVARRGRRAIGKGTWEASVCLSVWTGHGARPRSPARARAAPFRRLRTWRRRKCRGAPRPQARRCCRRRSSRRRRALPATATTQRGCGCCFRALWGSRNSLWSRVRAKHDAGRREQVDGRQTDPVRQHRQIDHRCRCSLKQTKRVGSARQVHEA